MSNLVWKPAVELAQMIRDRQLSAIELLDAHLKQIAQQLDAVIGGFQHPPGYFS